MIGERITVFTNDIVIICDEKEIDPFKYVEEKNKFDCIRFSDKVNKKNYLVVHGNDGGVWTKSSEEYITKYHNWSDVIVCCHPELMFKYSSFMKSKAIAEKIMLAADWKGVVYIGIFPIQDGLTKIVFTKG